MSFSFLVSLSSYKINYRFVPKKSTNQVWFEYFMKKIAEHGLMECWNSLRKNWGTKKKTDLHVTEKPECRSNEFKCLGGGINENFEIWVIFYLKQEVAL